MPLKFLRLATPFAAIMLVAACDTSPVDSTLEATSPRKLREEPIDLYLPEDPGGGDLGGGDLGGGDPGGGTSIPPWDPPPSPLGGLSVPLEYGFNTGQPVSCLQNPHVWVGFSLDVPQGTTLYPTGVVVPKSRARFHFYNAAGQLVKVHVTQPARDNCVIHHEPEAMSTWDMPPGYYYILASFWTVPYYNSGVYTGYPLGLTYEYQAVMRIR